MVLRYGDIMLEMERNYLEGCDLRVFSARGLNEGCE